jgi:alpha-glucuronidase
MVSVRAFRLLVPFLVVMLSNALQGQDGDAAWLRYAPLANGTEYAASVHLPAVIAMPQSTLVLQSAQRELTRGIEGVVGRIERQTTTIPEEDAFVLGTVDDLNRAFRSAVLTTLPPSSFRLRRMVARGHTYWLIAGGDDRGVLYGVFRILTGLARAQDFSDWSGEDRPSSPVRWVNQWDNMDGSIERGYAGHSIFFEDGKVRGDLRRAGEYARLLASVGLNGCTVNNVNADLQMLSSARLTEVARIAEVFRPWGVRLSLAVDLSSPTTVGHLSTFDPLDQQVIAWWKQKADEIYRLMPDFAGFVVKADSEGRVGPSRYRRSPADAANVLARALKPHGGLVLYRGFVYNHHLDWRDPKADRARAGYDNFRALDGKFDDNVVVQIKHGPIDFQVREPVSPLFAALSATNQAIELQITQEYTGQQRHLVYMVPMWKEALDTDLRIRSQQSNLRDVVTGRFFGRTIGGFVGVANVGMDEDWLAHPLAMANLYGFGRLAWDPTQSPDGIAREWAQLTFGNKAAVVEAVTKMQLASWPAYENYTGPLGIGTLTDIIHVHYGPGIESSERNGWGQWHRSDRNGLGMDRTDATGTGYIGQYPPELARLYESLTTMPDNLLLFMHHVPYSYRLHSGKTVIQHIYDSHYEGAATASNFVRQWSALNGAIDDRVYRKVLDLLTYQAGHAIVWRDAICRWFFATSGVPDEKGRVNHYPNRLEAESMRLDGYQVVAVVPWETASAGEAVSCNRPASCTASSTVTVSPGWYKIAVQYFSPNVGTADYQLFLNDQLLSSWHGYSGLPSAHLDGHTSTRHEVAKVALRNGDKLTITGTGQLTNPAAVDYIELEPADTAP